MDAPTLHAERRRLFLATGGLVWIPVAGVLRWGGLGLAGLAWSSDTWVRAALGLAFVAAPGVVAFVLFVVRRLEDVSPLSRLILPALLPVALGPFLALAAGRAEPSLVPLVLVVAFSGHWPVFGWLLGTRIYSIHTVVRVLGAVGLWFLVPDGRFTVVPFATAAVYLLTVLAVLLAVRTARTESR